MDYKKLIEQISFVAKAHQENALPTAKTLRVFPSGEKNPYFTHSLWCSMMILLDTHLPEKIRIPGAEALLLHDLIEDTSLTLPKDTSDEVVDLVDEMTYSDWQAERDIVPTRPLIIQLLKLYDKVATLYDECAPKGDKLKEWLSLTKTLTQNVRSEYGELNIVLLAEIMVAKFEKTLY
jgi:hypothetical protein